MDLKKIMVSEVASVLEETTNFVTNRLVMESLLKNGKVTLEEATFFNSLAKEVITEAAEEFIPDTISFEEAEVQFDNSAKELEEAVSQEDVEAAKKAEAKALEEAEAAKKAEAEAKALEEATEAVEVTEAVELTESELIVNRLIAKMV